MNDIQDKREVSMEREVSEIKADVKQVKEALIGNFFTPIGLIKQVENNTTDIMDIKDFMKKIKMYFGAAVAVGTLTGYILTMILNWFNHVK